MDAMNSMLDKQVEITFSGIQQPLKGVLLEVSSDLIVIYNELNFYYIPTIHLQYMTLNQHPTTFLDPPTEYPFELESSSISYRKMLMSAKGMFVEIYITGNQSVHGYLTHIMNDYFAFHSPIFQTIFISMKHVKYVVPYHPNTTPYSMKLENFLVQPSQVTFSRTFEQQLKKLETMFVVLDLGENPHKIGVLNTCNHPFLEVHTATGKSVIHSDHVKTIHLPASRKGDNFTGRIV
ncbi:DUF2642 domain-containing protein [Paenibacillus sp. HWE-109]|uniref:DUF2642 domain-containing protein n=1 Tax=Paenibacillus sp. HWE-109 TaxID=1306526 RepID=UPI001EE14409|nr:DUF2642 domain-containing protein [Paenibacillus sp. HWE-109]UKS29172.1 DUF2642 domain-containing protein [Paenibacillus sp. HWE-109]